MIRAIDALTAAYRCAIWAIDPRWLAASLRRLMLAPDESREARERMVKSSRPRSAVAVLPITGPIQQKEDEFLYWFGGTAVDSFKRDFDAALADPAVKTILMDVDSPGGSVYGVGEVAEHIRKSRGGSTRIVAQANSVAASAAYHLAAQADEFVVTPSGEVGSIGVFSLHLDHSKMLEEIGVKPTFIFAGKHKVEGNFYEPLSDEAREFEQKRVDEYYSDFVWNVAKGRGTTPETVRNNFGQGRMFGAKDAKAAGMVDRIATIEETLSRFGAATTAGASAATKQRRLNQLMRSV